MSSIDLTQHAKLTYSGGAGSFTERYPTLAEAVDTYHSLDRHLQMTAVIQTPSRTFEDEEISAIPTEDGTGALSAEGVLKCREDPEGAN